MIARFIKDDPTQVFLPSSVRYHEAVQSEQSDPDWGPGAAEAMENYLRTSFGNQADLLNVDCRTDLCELQFVSTPGDSTSSRNDLQQAIAKMSNQPWWQTWGFDQSTGLSTFADGRLIIVYFYSRK